MKHFKHLLSLLTITVVLGLGSHASHAQSPYRYSIDTDIHTLRQIRIPDFRYHYDDYLQYAPAALMFGMKAYGLESMSSWQRMLVSDVFSAAIMAAGVNGIKYTVGRLRPDGSAYNSFPSGHTATAFMSATLLYKEYGWKYPLVSIGGYTAAAVTGVSRIMNNKHWMTDVVAGAAIGIGSVHLGYWLSDKIFKNKGLSESYRRPEFTYDSTRGHFTAELFFGRRFMIGGKGGSSLVPMRGGLAGVQADIPLYPDLGITVRGSMSSMTWASGAVNDMPAVSAGGYWSRHFLKVLEFQGRVMAGAAWMNGIRAELCGEAGMNLILDNNFKLKVFAGLDSFGPSGVSPWINTLTVGYGASWYW